MAFGSWRAAISPQTGGHRFTPQRGERDGVEIEQEQGEQEQEKEKEKELTFVYFAWVF